jgi:ankyrin repeat protein
MCDSLLLLLSQHGRTALGWATATGQVDSVQALLEANAEVNCVALVRPLYYVVDVQLYSKFW